MSDLIKHVARAQCASAGHLLEEFEGEELQAALDLARIAIDAADSFRAEEKRKNCKHWNRRGMGALGSDGSSWTTWHCMECGASYDSRTAENFPSLSAPPHVLQPEDSK